MNVDQLLAAPPRITEHRYTKRDTILYALGVGAGQRGDHSDLRFVYEEDLLALPSMAVVLGYPGFWQKEPQYGIDWRRVLHAEQSCKFHRPLPPCGEVRSEMSIDSIVDKGSAKGCLLSATRKVFDVENGSLLATIRQISFLRGNGGCGSGGSSLPGPYRVPDRAADGVMTEATLRQQALLYRLSGDYNPLHVDPAVAAAANFHAPILHGLCTFGIAGRAVLLWACGNDPAQLGALQCRFTAPVYPGDVLQTELWREPNGVVAFRVSVPARKQVALDCGRAEIHTAQASGKGPPAQQK